ncbi:hypothetical protein FORC25_0993 [Clostridium perfringens]|nr:hypothetical protein FORC25_0993 [Clostridium perfringens]
MDKINLRIFYWRINFLRVRDLKSKFNKSLLKVHLMRIKY